MKIYITDLAAYNEGALIGEWIELPSADIEADIERVLISGSRWSVSKGYMTKEDFNSECYHEEIFITDYEDCPFPVSEFSSPVELDDLAQQIDLLEDYEIKKLNFLTECQGYDVNDALGKLEDCDLYENMSFKDLAYEFADQGLFGDIPDYLTNYIDYDAMARDLQFDYTEHDGDIFRCD